MKSNFIQKKHLQYWPDFYRKEHDDDPRNEMISAIHSILQNTQQLGIITIYINLC